MNINILAYNTKQEFGFRNYNLCYNIDYIHVPISIILMSSQ